VKLKEIGKLFIYFSKQPFLPLYYTARSMD